MRGGAIDEWPLLKDNDVSPAQLGEMVGNTGTGDSATNNDDSRLILHGVLLAYEFFTSCSQRVNCGLATFPRKRLRW